ncbi:MAG: hypothetical protein N3D84_00810 [Candidatus Woesearchaeota archaeon]|nr:hypothetical protein [Candidatus Woesearchaeota archaeon]
MAIIAIIKERIKINQSQAKFRQKVENGPKNHWQYICAKKNKKPKKLLLMFLKNIVFNIAIFSIAVFLYVIFVKLMVRYEHFFLIFQIATAKIVYYMQAPFFDVALNGTSLLYKGFSVNVTFDCIGLRQSLFFLILVFSFLQADIIKRVLAFAFVPLIIAANILRISLLYPLSLMFGIEKTIVFHEFMYSYGNGIFIFILLIIWFYIFVYKMQKRGRG